MGRYLGRGVGSFGAVIIGCVVYDIQFNAREQKDHHFQCKH